jgi:hypothetical protein
MEKSPLDGRLFFRLGRSTLQGTERTRHPEYTYRETGVTVQFPGGWSLTRVGSPRRGEPANLSVSGRSGRQCVTGIAARVALNSFRHARVQAPEPLKT